MSRPALSVLRPGLFTTVQDGGRGGYADIGVTPSGALDPLSMRLANALVGNAETAGGLEIVHAGPELEVAAPSVRLAFAGAEARGGIAFAGGETAPVPADRSFLLRAGDRLSIDRLEGAAVGFLAIGGGLDLPSVLGSQATHARAGLGGLDGRPLIAGDALPLVHGEASGGDLALSGSPARLFAEGPIRVVLGPQDDAFTADALAAFLSGPYRIGRESDRMGLRLEGPKLAHAGAFEIPSDGIAPGSIQVPGTGQPIVQMAERGTVGGYAKIATVASADLPRIGRARQGDDLSFTAVTRAEAEDLRRAQEAALQALIRGMGPAPTVGAPDPALLGGANLISGVWDADS